MSSCPYQCAPCTNEIYCDKTGLVEIPKLKNMNFNRVVLINQQFVNPILSSSNFSNYHSIAELSIRTCNINKVQSNTLSDLTNLRNVDFSDNTDLFIENNAFFGLNLQILKLDNIGIIKLDLHAFKGLTVSTLSIQSSNLLSLPTELIDPISSSLTKLFLKGNQLRSLDSGLRPVLIGLKALELQENPFICNCSLLWLSEILDSKRHMKTLSPFDNQEELYPRCVSPPQLRKQYVYTLVDKLKNCMPPTIVKIDVVFHSFTTVGLYCFTRETENANEKTEIGWFPFINNSSHTEIWNKSIQVSLSSSLSKYKCKAKNALGDSEIDVFITWSETEKQDSIDNKTGVYNYENNQRKTSFLWEKVFSLFEMICAIFGTLVITVVLFFLFCCCYVERNHFLMMGKDKRKLQTKSYPSYERGIYSDTRIYCETDMDVSPFPPPPPPTPPPLSETRLISKNIFQSM